MIQRMTLVLVAVLLISNAALGWALFETRKDAQVRHEEMKDGVIRLWENQRALSKQIGPRNAAPPPQRKEFGI